MVPALRLRLGVVFAGFVLLPSLGAAAPILTITPVSSSASVGDSFSLDVTIEDVVDLYAYQFDITFDPVLLRGDDIVEGAFLAGGGSTLYVPGDIDNVLGTISFTANSLASAVPGVTGSGVLATLEFTALAIGTSGVAISNVILLDSFLLDVADVAIEDGSVTVRERETSVPEPGSLALVLTGVVGSLIRRRTRAA